MNARQVLDKAVKTLIDLCEPTYEPKLRRKAASELLKFGFSELVHEAEQERRDRDGGEDLSWK